MAQLSAEGLLAGRYEVGQLLGRGGMAEVRAAHDERLDREVAVKILRPELSADESVRQRFEAEARTAARLSHPNVVNVFDAGSDGDRVYMVMERLPGTTLENEMSDGPMAVPRVIDVGQQVASALAVAHAAGIVHRDIKPGNVLTCPDGTVKVADFGIATVMGSASVTATGLVVGTPAYLSPERATGESATLRSDVYSVGALLYACLAGRRPFEADSAVALMMAMQSRSPTPLSELRADVPVALAAVIEKAMARRPEDRFSDAAELTAALTALPASGLTRATTVVGPAAGADATSVMAAVGASAAAGIGAASGPIGLRPAMAPPVEGPGWRRASIILVTLALLILVAGLAYGLTKGIGSSPSQSSTTTSSSAGSSTTTSSTTTSSTSTSSTTSSTSSTTTTSTTEPSTTVSVTVPDTSSPPSSSPDTTAASG